MSSLDLAPLSGEGQPVAGVSAAVLAHLIGLGPGERRVAVAADPASGTLTGVALEVEAVNEISLSITLETWEYDADTGNFMMPVLVVAAQPEAPIDGHEPVIRVIGLALHGEAVRCGPAQVGRVCSALRRIVDAVDAGDVPAVDSIFEQEGVVDRLVFN